MCIFAIRLGNPTLLSYFQHFAPPLPPGRGGGGWPGEGTAPDRARGAGKSVPGAPTAWQPPAPSARLLRRGGPVPQRAECGSGKRAKCSVRSAPLARPSASLRGALVGVGGRGTLPHGLRISCVRGGAGWAGLSSVRNAGKGAKRPPKYLKSNWFYK